MNVIDPVAALPDEELVRLVISGEKEHFAHIVRRFNQRLYRTAMAMLNDDAEAEDVMQVAYINAYEHLSAFQFRSSFATWLTRILINECLLRMKKRKKAMALFAAGREETQSRVTDNSLTPMEKVINNELKTALEKAISQLPDKYRSVFVLRELEGLNVEDTGHCLNLTTSNVKVRLNRAKALLQNSLGPILQRQELFHFHLERCDRMTKNVMKAIEKNGLRF